MFKKIVLCTFLGASLFAENEMRDCFAVNFELYNNAKRIVQDFEHVHPEYKKCKLTQEREDEAKKYVTVKEARRKSAIAKEKKKNEIIDLIAALQMHKDSFVLKRKLSHPVREELSALVPSIDTTLALLAIEHDQVEQDSSEMQNCLYFHVGAKDNVSPDETKENLKKLFDSITLDRLGLSNQN